jgi:predicted DNA-binding transcriptional regulator YafY
MAKCPAAPCCAGNADVLAVEFTCPFREDLRTFRIDRMQDVIALQRGNQLAVDDAQEFFAAVAANSTEEEGQMLRLAARDG